jgi:hypothetical protein
MSVGRKFRKLTLWLRTASLMEPFGALASEVVEANSLKNMVGPCGLEPQTSTVSTRGLPKFAEVVQDIPTCGLKIREQSVRQCDAPRSPCAIDAPLNCMIA